MFAELDREIFCDESWKPIYFWSDVQRSRTRVAKNIASVGLCTLVSAGFL